MDKAVYAVVALGLLLTVALAFASVALLQAALPSLCNQSMLYNGRIWLPTPVINTFLGDRINLDFLMFGGSAEVSVYGLVTRNGLSHLHCGKSESWDFEASMNDSTALKLATSDHPITSFVRFWRDGEIRLTANGAENQAKLTLADKLVANDTEPVPDDVKKFVVDSYSDAKKEWASGG